MGPGWNLSLVVEFVALMNDDSVVGMNPIVFECLLSHAGICIIQEKRGRAPNEQDDMLEKIMRGKNPQRPL
jgi:hypothetical protein